MLIVKCYLFVVLFFEERVISSKVKNNPDQFYEEWVPAIYSLSMDGLEDQAKRSLFVLVQADFNKIKVFFTQHGMKPGFFSRDKTDMILVGYMAAGLTLRTVERSQEE